MSFVYINYLIQVIALSSWKQPMHQLLQSNHCNLKVLCIIGQLKSTKNLISAVNPNITMSYD